MSKNLLIEALRANPKNKDMFNSTGTFLSYKTGYPTLDYFMGYQINVFDKNDNIIESYPSLGISAGSIVTIIGKSHVGKTTLAIQISANIVRPFPNGTVIHYDLEGGSNNTRIKNLTKLSINEIDDGKYILKEDGGSIDEIKATISKIYLDKINNPDLYSYDTGKLNEFGRPIVAFEPTCIIIDSVPSLSNYINENTKDGVKDLEEISTQTERMRLTAEIGRFLSEIMPMCKKANITIFLINHIKARPGIGVPQAPEMPYLKQDETLPAGKAVQYYSNTMIRLTAVGSEKYTKDEHGFEGFGVSCTFIKNRSSFNGTTTSLVFDKLRGYDSLRSSISYCKDLGFLGGNKNGYYINDNKDKKFTSFNIHQIFREDREMYKLLYATIIPHLEENLSKLESTSDIGVPEEEMDY